MTTKDNTAKNPISNPQMFLALHLTLGCVVAAYGGYRIQAFEATSNLPQLRDEPLQVLPEYDYDVVVSDEQLERVLTKLRPRFSDADTKINHIDHALRFWTSAARFNAEGFISGTDMRRLLLDHKRFAEIYGEDNPPLLMDTPDGVRVRTRDGVESASHVDHTMACLAEVGTTLDFPVYSPIRETTFRALVEQSLTDFSLNQVEYEWSALTYALFLPPVRQWQTSEGQQVSFDLLARRMMREVLSRGVCFSNHRLHGLVMFLRVDDQIQILEPQTREDVTEFLIDATARLVRHQSSEGCWNVDWPYGPVPQTEPTSQDGDGLADRILATGHALEWWALAPEEIHPPRHVLAAGGQWLVRAIDDLSEEDTLRYYTYLTHAGRALALWRGQSPAEALPPAIESPEESTPTSEPQDTVEEDIEPVVESDLPSSEEGQRLDK